MGVGHILQLKMSGLGVVLNEIDSLQPHKDEGEKENIDKLDGQKQKPQRRPFLKPLES